MRSITRPTSPIQLSALRGRERSLVTEWMKGAAPGNLVGQVPDVDDGVQRLLSTPIDLRTPPGRRAADTLEQLGWVQPFAAQTMRGLVERYGSDHLKDVVAVYNGHFTQAMFPLFPMLGALGLHEGISLSSANSGTAMMLRALELQTKRTINRAEPTWDLAADQSAAQQTAVKTVLSAAEQAERTGKVLIIDKGAFITHGMTPKLRDLVRRGTVRFVVHNSDDLHALGPLRHEAWCVDVYTSALKRLEARFIGEQYALLGAQSARMHMQKRIGETSIFVLGFGDIGRGIAKACVRFGCPADRIVVVDSSAEQRAAAQAVGFSVRDPGSPPPRGGRPQDATVLVATPGCGVDASNVHAFGRRVLVIAATSAGKGIDVKGLRANASLEEVLMLHSGLSVRRRTTFGPYADRLFKVPCGDEETTAMVVCDGFSPNLLQESWRDRFAVTASVVAIGVAEAAAMTGPGLHALDQDFQETSMDRAVALGLLVPRPLDEHAEGIGDLVFNLKRDMLSFTPVLDHAADNALQERLLRGALVCGHIFESEEGDPVFEDPFEVLV